jgi:succinate dehydrogenase / fumarate reductase, cytochrome b subunit
MPMPDELRSDTSPVFFDLYRIKFPVTAVVSMGHRVSGVLLALCVPVLVYLFQLSLSGPDGYARAGALFQHPAIGAVTVVLIWALAHHVLAGVRHLLFDIHVGTALRTARISAWLVLAVELAIAILAIKVIL